ncbi:MAG: CusA/CzcA family heavy metal efflux RND transporter [Proteobacteria bacterium]|nr:CusA/CzcA family heavy metal efflux RND transporter [Pseudomonadota bacterium]
MIKKIIEFSANNKFFVIIITTALVTFAVYTLKNIPLDAIPDLSDTQVIIYTKWDRNPSIIEDQVTYPIVSSLLGAPKVKAIRGFSDYGFSYVYVIFEDGTDIYWARSRVIEYLSKIQGRLPEGAKTEVGPDATGVGWIFQYALVDKTGKYDLAKQRTLQDWYIKYALQSVAGVAEVATVGGFEKQYQVTINPSRLQAYNISVMDIVNAIKKSSNEIGGRLIEWTGKEYMVTAEGYIRNIETLRKIAVKSVNGTPVFLSDIATVSLGPDIRRGLAELNGEGEVVGGIVVMRHKENALNVIKRVKEKLDEIKSGLPEGIEIVTTYDRSDLIRRAIDTLKNSLIEEIIIVSLVILIFLWHFPSALVPIITIPISVLLAFIPMYFMGITSNIMSLAGIAISIGVLVDGAIVEVENAYKKIEHWIADGRKGDFHKVRLEALMEVGPSVFFSLLVITVAFLPVFTLIDQEGRLFKPLAWTKTLTMALASLLAITLDPSVRMFFTRLDPFCFKPRFLSKLATTLFVGTYYPEERHPISRFLFKIYEPTCRFVLNHPRKVIATALIIIISVIPVYFKLGSEFMPPLNEGTILYMPTTLPGISVTEAKRLLILQDRILKTFPEVETVFGKAGRADTSTDPAPFSMMETTVVLKPKEQWREKKRWYSEWAPEFLKKLLRPIWDDRISYEELISEMDKALQIPGNTNAWTMPIKGRIDMLTTGVRTPIGIKIMGRDLKKIEEIGIEIERVIKDLKGTRSVFAERVGGGYYVNFTPKREMLARYGLTLSDLQMVIATAIGGENILTTIEGRERYNINVRYERDFRTSLDSLQRVLVTTMMGFQIPLGELADIYLSYGPSMIRNENGMIAGYVYVDIENVDLGTYVKLAKDEIAKRLKLPEGYTLTFSGQYENMLRVKERLKIILPVTFVLIIFILYLNTRSVVKSFIVLLAVPFSLVGAILLLYLLDYNISIAVWVGMIALMGLDAETGVFMLVFLDLAYEDARKNGKLNNIDDLKEAIVNGAVKRIRPKIMTVLTSMIGLMPIMWSTGTGADMMKRITAPMVGGLTTSFLMELVVYPAIYLIWKKRELKTG